MKKAPIWCTCLPVADFVRENPDAVVVVAVDSCPLPKEYAPVAAVGTAVLANKNTADPNDFAHLARFCKL